jgi:hypothetical protein
MKPIVIMLSAAAAAVALSGSVWAADADTLDTVKIEAAKSPADHEAIAKAYDAEAVRFEKMAGMHKGLAQTYTSQPGGKAWHKAQARHCADIAASLQTAAKESRELAAEHRKMEKGKGE